MSEKNDHAICDDCWTKKNPQRMPVRWHDLIASRCCVCGNPTISGIFARGDLKDFMCKGDHDSFVAAYGKIPSKSAEKKN